LTFYLLFVSSADELRSAMRDTFGAAASSSSSGLFASAAPLSTLTMANDDQEDRRAFEALQRDALALRAQQKVKQLAELSRSGVHAHAFSAMAQANDELPTVSALERGDFDAVQMDSEVCHTMLTRLVLPCFLLKLFLFSFRPTCQMPVINNRPFLQRSMRPLPLRPRLPRI
jgi:hypothetical protein